MKRSGALFRTVGWLYRMRSRYFLYVVLVAGAVAIQWPLWLGKGGIARMHSLEAELASIRAANDRLRAENDIVAAEIESLESGSGAVEERARMRLGMVRKDEVLFRFIAKGERKDYEADLKREAEQSGKPNYFAPKRSDLYTEGPAAPSKPAGR